MTNYPVKWRKYRSVKMALPIIIIIQNLYKINFLQPSRCTDWFFFNVALALRKANFVSRNIGLKYITPLLYCQPRIQFCFNSHFKWHLVLVSLYYRFGKKEPVDYKFTCRVDLCFQRFLLPPESDHWFLLNLVSWKMGRSLMRLSCVFNSLVVFTLEPK